MMSTGTTSSLLGLTLYTPLGVFENKLALRGKVTFVLPTPDQGQIPRDRDPEL